MKAQTPNKRLLITLTPDTEERLRMYAEQNHMSVSQAITYMTWHMAKVDNGQVRGQQVLNV